LHSIIVIESSYPNFNGIIPFPEIAVGFEG
jgi:hypothetical protein